jgi:hypothetical protein
MICLCAIANLPIARSDVGGHMKQAAVGLVWRSLAETTASQQRQSIDRQFEQL